MEISVRVEYRELQRGLTNLEKTRIPTAARNALSDTAKHIAMKTMRSEADKVFEGGAVSFTKRGFLYKKADKLKLRAYVYINTKQAEYMKYQIHGGTRKPNKKVIAIPTDKARKNKYGNITQTTRKKYFANNNGKYPVTDAGIYERYDRNRKRRKVMNFVSSASYDPKFNFFGIARRAVADRTYGFRAQFNKNWARELAKLNRAGGVGR